MFVSKFKCPEGAKHTHLLLNGGKLCVQPEQDREFMEEYAKALGAKEKLYVVECRPPIFKFMIDIDLKEPPNSPEWNFERLVDLATTIQRVVFEFYEIDMNVICLVAPNKTITSGGKKYVKTGVHLIWPRHFTNSTDALLIRQGILVRVTEKYGERPENPWEDVFDDRIYTSNGYRMVGSDKMTRGSPEGREYWPMFVIDSEGNQRDAYFTRISTDKLALVLDTSIRFVPVKVSIPITKIPTWLPVTAEVTKTPRRGGGSTKGIRVSIETKEYEALREFMMQKLPNAYRNQVIKSVQKYPDGNLLIITDSRHCMNIGREHNSCGIYFFATPTGMYQKCLCPCINLKDRIFGYCKDYTSSCFEFPEEVRTLLFPPNMAHKKSKIGTKHPNLSSTQRASNFQRHLSDFCNDIFESITK